MGQSPQIKIVGVQAVRALALRTLDLRLPQAWLDGADDAQRDLVLDFENVAERPVISLGPDVGAVRGLDELAGDANAVPGLAQAAFEHVAHAEFPADLLHVDGASLVGKAGIAGDHEQPFHPRQAGDDVLDDAVDEIFLLRDRRSCFETAALRWKGLRQVPKFSAPWARPGRVECDRPSPAARCS